MLCAALLGILTAPDPTSGHVEGFLPSTSAFKFDNNHWPDVPNYTFSVLNHEVNLGSASAGLCGGMVFAVRDLFEAKASVPDAINPPDPGSALFNYIVAGLTRTFTFDNVKRYLDAIQSDDATSGGSKGLGWHEVRDEWPLVKADIDAGLLSPLGLVHGKEPTGLGYLTGWQHLSRCHQVLAYGYTVDGGQVTVQIYDPNYPGDNEAIAFDTTHLDQACPLSVTNYRSSDFRFFFREAYTYHDPKTPLTCRLGGATVISSPGISN